MHPRIRAAWYALYEPARLRLERAAHTDWPFLQEPLVSVIIPTFNRAELLIERGLGSVLSQSYENMEIIVAAHGCTDRTEELVRKIGDRRVRLLSVPRSRTYPPTPENHWFAGPVVPINAGLAAASGDYIARNDDDDIWSRDHLERLLRFAESGNYEFVSALHRTHEGISKPYYLGDGVSVGGVQTWLYRGYMRFMKANPDCWRKSYNRVNDTDLQDRMFKAGVRMGFLDRVVAEVLPRPGETTVGLQAYRQDSDNKTKHYAFQ